MNEETVQKLMTCNICIAHKVDEPFQTPYGDGIGEALMIEHLKKFHSIDIKYGRRQ